VDERVFSYFQPKGKKRNVKEYLKDGESEERYNLSVISLTLVNRPFRK
jgi:hypothetical protein